MSIDIPLDNLLWSNYPITHWLNLTHLLKCEVITTATSFAYKHSDSDGVALDCWLTTLGADDRTLLNNMSPLYPPMIKRW